jgi:hypothetical protein
MLQCSGCTPRETTLSSEQDREPHSASADASRSRTAWRATCTHNEWCSATCGLQPGLCSNRVGPFPGCHTPWEVMRKQRADAACIAAALSVKSAFEPHNIPIKAGAADRLHATAPEYTGALGQVSLQCIAALSGLEANALQHATLPARCLLQHLDQLANAPWRMLCSRHKAPTPPLKTPSSCQSMKSMHV